MTFAPTAAERLAELSTSLIRVQDRIGTACREAGRVREDVRLIVVTKFFPSADVEMLAQLGITDIGENRDQEASAKIAALPPDVRGLLHVHFIGQLQTNKAGSVATYADTVHSMDRDKLVLALDRAATVRGRDIGVLVQVNLGASVGGGREAGAARGGIRPDGVGALANSIAAAPHLNLRGLMGVAPQGADPDEAFGQLAKCAHALRADHPEATWISAGMSGDLESAVANGATHLRVGSAILGSRPPHG
jgi:pyridoxal phosphate enzyme (YggS family)